MQRLYVVVRSDLEPGAQLAQSCHALSSFAHQYPALHATWQEGEQNLVVLSIAGETALGELLRSATAAGVRCSPFHEPDFGNELTAVAFDGGVAKLVSSLGLALRACLDGHAPTS